MRVNQQERLQVLDVQLRFGNIMLIVDYVRELLKLNAFFLGQDRVLSELGRSGEYFRDLFENGVFI